MLHAPIRWLVSLGVCAAACGTTGCRTARPDDALEPNDDLASATRLVAGQAVEGRANQGNPDVFAIQAAAGQTIVLRLESKGNEDCAAFQVTAPSGTVVYEDKGATCTSLERAQPTASASLTVVQGFGYELRVTAAETGLYDLTINELGQADNVFPFSWDYRLTATLE